MFVVLREDIVKICMMNLVERKYNMNIWHSWTWIGVRRNTNCDSIVYLLSWIGNHQLLISLMKAPYVPIHWCPIYFDCFTLMRKQGTSKLIAIATYCNFAKSIGLYGKWLIALYLLWLKITRVYPMPIHYAEASDSFGVMNGQWVRVQHIYSA